MLFFAISTTKVTRVLAEDNNVYGIHITDKEDIPLAAELVNGAEGEWGYVTLVIQSDDRSYDKWQPIFYDLMKYKLIPIVRIAGKVDGNVWLKPTADDAKQWADFLDSLYWPTKRRIVSIYNEPNHGREWGGNTDPADYAKVLSATIDELKRKNGDFFVLNAGFDASTPHEPPAFYDLGKYFDEMNASVPGIFDKLDGWASHSYPNPGFSGKVEDIGKGTIRGYVWELEYLKNKFGVTKELPVFIKETGWPYRLAENPRVRTAESTAADNIVRAFDEVWLKDPRVVSVTPFLLRYRGVEFLHFSWINLDNTPTSIYSVVSQKPKTKGNPERDSNSSISKVDIPSTIIQGLETSGSIVLKNTGNRPWSKNENIVFSENDDYGLLVRDNFTLPDNQMIMPGQSYQFRFNIKSEVIPERVTMAFSMKQNLNSFGERLVVPINIKIPTRIVIKITNPPPEGNFDGAIGIANKLGLKEIYTQQSVNKDGELGVFEHPLLIPDELTNVVIAMPRRERVSIVITPKEGQNVIDITLPDEKSAFTVFVDRVSQLIRRP